MVKKPPKEGDMGLIPDPGKVPHASELQQLKLLECQLQLLAVVVSFIIVAINGQGTELDDAGRIVWLRTPAEDGF